uniref:(northern house mosquito) hypothetical protein n=1 Tax=Culex pipiens TaxID=7175 RepID=A0A8D8NZ69_CULPI
MVFTITTNVQIFTACYSFFIFFFLFCFVLYFSLLYSASLVSISVFFSAMCSLPMFSASKSFVWFPEFVRLNTTILGLYILFAFSSCCAAVLQMCLCVFCVSYSLFHYQLFTFIKTNEKTTLHTCTVSF